MLFSQHAKHNVLDQERENDKIKAENMVKFEEQMPQSEKRKLFLEFLDVFLKDETTKKQSTSKPDNFKENNWIRYDIAPYSFSQKCFYIVYSWL